MPKAPSGEWKPADATKFINACAASDAFTPSLTGHAKSQMALRDLLMGDLPTS